jgi:hypothetical protein
MKNALSVCVAASFFHLRGIGALYQLPVDPKTPPFPASQKKIRDGSRLDRGREDSIITW